MTTIRQNTLRLAALAGFGLLGGCAQLYGSPAPAPVAYNPPGTALAALPAENVTRFRVTFASASTAIDADGQATVNSAADAMQANAALTATVIGSSDTVGSDASNMLLSKQRAVAVHDALIRTGKVPDARIETRWTGDRQANAQPVVAGQTQAIMADAGSRAVEIALH
jgi:outer membrane protein OmpA-like peptidoglycan-associated protein